MASKATPFLGWFVGSTGAVLLYSAYKNKSPFSVIQQTLGVGTVVPIQTIGVKEITADTAGAGGASGLGPAGASGAGVSGGGTGSFGGSTLSFQGLTPSGAKDEGYGTQYGPLVTFGHGSMTLRQQAAASFQQVQTTFGHDIPLTGASRTQAAQLAGFLASPGTFLDPRNGAISKHVMGIAVDVAGSVSGGWDNPALVAAFTNAGWFRAGKDVGGRPEPWHWSYKERG
jgi:hypothetical protein